MIKGHEEERYSALLDDIKRSKARIKDLEAELAAERSEHRKKLDELGDRIAGGTTDNPDGIGDPTDPHRNQSDLLPV